MYLIFHARSVAKSTLFVIESVMFEIKRNKDRQFEKNDENGTSRKLLETLYDDEYRVFVRLLRFVLLTAGMALLLLCTKSFVGQCINMWPCIEHPR